MADGFTICRAVPEDLDEIVSIIETAVQHAVSADWFVPDDRKFLERHLEQSGFILVAKSAAARIAAYLLVRFPGADDDNLGRELTPGGPVIPLDELAHVAHIESTAVCPDFYGNHLQSWLVQEAETYLKPLAYRHLMATVHPDNRYSLNSMLRQGYRIVSTTQKYGGLRRHILYKEL